MSASAELRELYQSVILDHNKHPRNFRAVEGANRSAEGDNPLCGDQLRVELRLEGDVVTDVGFEGHGCAISKASASLMTELVKGKPAAEAERLFGDFVELVTGDPRAAPRDENLGKLAVFGGVREFPMRVKCATLCWHTLHSALEGSGEVVTTE